jgi:signal transduction histidine kinase/DNA-binding response OmpR family regulator
VKQDRTEKTSLAALIIPFVLFACYIIFALFTHSFTYFFGVFFAICCLRGTYFKRGHFLLFIFLANVIAAVLVWLHLPLTNNGRADVPFSEILINWIIMLVCSFTLYIIVHSASGKNAHAARTTDSFVTLMATTPNIIALVDDMNCVQYISKPLANLAYLDYAEIAIGRPLIDLFHDREIKTMISEILESDGYYEDTKELRINGETHYFKITSDKLSGSAKGAFIDITDITPIMDARFEAEAASKSKGDFLSNMSHEMRTPMNAIIGMTTIGRSSHDLERKDYAFGKIQDASTHLLGVINDILDMSKIEAHKLELSYAEFNFEKMLQKVVSIINFKVEERGQDLSVFVDETIPQNLISDDLRLSQVITNLLSNAVKFTPEKGQIRLDARMLEENEDMCTIRIDVTDTGIGISEEQQSRLFSSFQQAESSTSRKFGGTGLGLAISKSIVEMMNGKIWIESELGHGATFAFTIQAQRGSAGKLRHRLLSPTVNWNNVRILAVDDTPDIQEYLRDVTQSLGVSCDIAISGEQAIEMIEANGPYDIYFVDWKMPGMNGIELSRKIKKDQKSNSIVTMISSGEWNTISDEAKEAGVDNFLAKPLFPSTIADCINECLSVSGTMPDDTVIWESNDFAAYQILLAEDIEINREIVMSLLEPTGLHIDCAENGEIALSMFKDAPQKYDMIFMDVQMPEMDGIESTKAIRALESPEAKTVPIVAMTANVFREDIDKCLDAGMNDHVGKPLDMEAVIALLLKYLPTKES